MSLWRMGSGSIKERQWALPRSQVPAFRDQERPPCKAAEARLGEHSTCHSGSFKMFKESNKFSGSGNVIGD